jgi:hypothetical protein
MLVLEQAGYVPTIINPIQVMGYTNHSLFSTIFLKKKFHFFGNKFLYHWQQGTKDQYCHILRKKKGSEFAIFT